MLVATIACVSHAQLEVVSAHNFPVTSGEMTPENATILLRDFAISRIARATDEPAPSKMASTPSLSYHFLAMLAPTSGFYMWPATTSLTDLPSAFQPKSSIASSAAATDPLPVIAA
jgi:hypothetical protein